MELIPKTNRSEGFEALRTDLNRSVVDLSNPWIQSFANDFLELLDDNPTVASAVDDSFMLREHIDQQKQRSSLTPSYAGNLALRSVHANLFNREGYPNSHKTVGSWKNDIEESVMNDNFRFRVGIRDVMSNVPSRYTTLHVLAVMMERRLRRPVNIIDIGASQNHGLKMIMGRPETLERPNSGWLGTRVYNRYMGLKPEIGNAIGVEKWVDSRINDLDHDTKKWAESCSLPPHEMIIETLRSNYREIDELSLPNLSMVMGEIGSEFFISDYPELVGSADIVFMSTVLYQMSEERRSQAIAQSINLLSKSGVLVVQDHVRIKKDGELDFNVNWKDKKSLPYRTAVQDKRFSEKGFVDVFKWTDGRAHTGKVAGLKGLLALGRLARN